MLCIYFITYDVLNIYVLEDKKIIHKSELAKRCFTITSLKLNSHRASQFLNSVNVLTSHTLFTHLFFMFFLFFCKWIQGTLPVVGKAHIFCVACKVRVKQHFH